MRDFLKHNIVLCKRKGEELTIMISGVLGYQLFAEDWNAYTTGPYRFAVWDFVHQRYNIPPPASTVTYLTFGIPNFSRTIAPNNVATTTQTSPVAGPAQSTATRSAARDQPNSSTVSTVRSDAGQPLRPPFNIWDNVPADGSVRWGRFVRAVANELRDGGSSEDAAATTTSQRPEPYPTSRARQVTLAPHQPSPDGNETPKSGPSRKGRKRAAQANDDQVPGLTTDAGPSTTATTPSNTVDVPVDVMLGIEVTGPAVPGPENIAPESNESTVSTAMADAVVENASA